MRKGKFGMHSFGLNKILLICINKFFVAIAE